MRRLIERWDRLREFWPRGSRADQRQRQHLVVVETRYPGRCHTTQARLLAVDGSGWIIVVYHN